MKLITVGIDPGLGGAIALLEDGAAPQVWDMPTEAKKGKGNQVDVVALALIAEKIRYAVVSDGEQRKTYAYLEQVSAGGPRMKGRTQGISSAFSFGDSYGCVRCFAASLLMPHALKHSSSWKTAMKLSAKKGKAYSLAVARRLIPTAQPMLTRKKDEGRAEALLLAYYCYQIEKSK